VIDIFRTLQDKILNYLSNYLESFIDSSFYQEVVRSERQREHDNARKINIEVGKPVQPTETHSPGKIDTCPQKYKNILVVDDSKIATKIASVALTKAGHSCVVANHGRVALDELAKQHFHIVLIDLYMPIMDGFETIHKFRNAQNMENLARAANTSSEVALPDVSETMSTGQASKSIRYSFHQGNSPDRRQRIIVIGMSSDSDRETVRRAEDAGVDHFISKPFSIEKLSNIIQSIETNAEWDGDQANIELVRHESAF
jgi:CheY-like chemotaxis protein